MKLLALGLLLASVGANDIRKYSKATLAENSDETTPLPTQRTRSSNNSYLRTAVNELDEDSDEGYTTADVSEPEEKHIQLGVRKNLTPTKSSYSTSNAKQSANVKERVGIEFLDEEQIEEVEPTEHVIITCPSDMTVAECRQYVTDKTPVTMLRMDGKKVQAKQPKVMHEMEATHTIAVEITKSQLKELDMEYETDPVRELAHIPESYYEEIIDQHRRLAQDIPLGVLQVKADEVWSQYEVTGDKVKVCVVDTGIVRGHEDFAGGVLDGSDNPTMVNPWFQDGNGHGTHVAGTVGARNNNRGVVGVAPDVELFIVRVFDNSGAFYSSDIQTAAQECANNGADIISMSLGGPGRSSSEERALRRLFEENGIITVAAAGNSGQSGNEISYPAAHSIVVSVGAVDFDGDYASFSTRNEFVDISAPGVNVRSTTRNGRYGRLSGTSMATPHVSGVLALLKSFRLNASAQDLVNAITSTAIDRGQAGKDIYYGHGIVDALAAIEKIEELYPSDDSNNDNGNNDSDGDNSNNNGGDNDEDNTPEPKVVSLEVYTDWAGRETSYRLNPYRDGLDQEGRFSDTIFYTGYNTLRNWRSYDETALVDPRGCYQLDIYDSDNDGIFGWGRGVRITYDGEVLYEGRDYGGGGYVLMGDSCPPS